MGSSDSSGRTADQTLYAKFWQAGNPPDFWDQVALSLAAQHQFSMVRTARLLALVNLSIADAIVGCWDAKVYLQFVAADYGDPTRRHGLERRYILRFHLDPAHHDTAFS